MRDNITRFGGDPSNVTIFGESGGGGKVGTLMCMPKARGLFHKAIIMSGTILNVNNRDMTQKLGKAVLKELGISEKDVDKIKDIPYQQLYDAGQRAMAASIGTRKPGTPMMWGFGPTPDGETLLQQPFQPTFPEFSTNIPVLIGTTFNELQRLQYDQPMTMDQAREQLQKTFGDETDAYVKAFAKAYPDYTPQDLVSIDWLFRPKTLITADAMAGGGNMYMYMFTWRSPVNKGSVHGHELKFCFNTLHHSPNELPQPTADDLKLADTMSSVWAQFAHNGRPNIDGLPGSPALRAFSEYAVFDNALGVWGPAVGACRRAASGHPCGPGDPGRNGGGQPIVSDPCPADGRRLCAVLRSGAASLPCGAARAIPEDAALRLRPEQRGGRIPGGRRGGSQPGRLFQ